MGVEKKFSEQFCDLLVQLGYRDCYFVAGGNSMHLLDAARTRFNCHPVVHEVSAVIAAEYGNAAESEQKAWALLTAGPGLTNAITGIAGSWLESREVLIVGGQVKSGDLKQNPKRQNGIQEIDGVELVRSITKKAYRVAKLDCLAEVVEVIDASKEGRKGPVFIEVPVDISGAKVVETDLRPLIEKAAKVENQPNMVDITNASDVVRRAQRPIFLLGQGISRPQAEAFGHFLSQKNIPVATTWTGADRLGFDFKNYVGRPNFFGMRCSNLIIQKADAIVAVGARMGIQQIGFNSDSFAKNAEVIHVDIDPLELDSEVPRKVLRVMSDGDKFLEDVIDVDLIDSKTEDWLLHCKEIMENFPLVESAGTSSGSYVNPYEIIHTISELLTPSDLVASCSSGGTFTAFMQSFKNKTGQVIMSNKGLASMGYGLAGAVGLAFSKKDSRVVLFEGDGGFAQNLQELGTVAASNLPIKMFVFDNNGYASIRTSQRAHFEGEYVGCDFETGLGLPDWHKLASAYGINYTCMSSIPADEELKGLLESSSPEFIKVLVDPDFEYIPKIKSFVQEDGSMISNPLHQMHPPIPSAMRDLAFKQIK